MIVYYQNCRGTKTQEFYRNSTEHDFDIIVGVETWLREGMEDGELIDTDVYSILRCDRNFEHTGKSRGGGVLIAVEYTIMNIKKKASNFELCR